jgi:hypothetical protein
MERKEQLKQNMIRRVHQIEAKYSTEQGATENSNKGCWSKTVALLAAMD